MAVLSTVDETATILHELPLTNTLLDRVVQTQYDLGGEVYFIPGSSITTTRGRK